MRRDSLLPSDWPGRWPPSTYLVLLSVQFLLAMALALFVSTDSIADTVGGYAFLAFVIGVVLRLGEQVADNRMRRLLLPAVARLRTRLFRGMNPLRRALGLQEVPDSSRSSSEWNARRRRLAALIAMGTVLGGSAIVILRSSDPVTVVSSTFLTGWTLAVWFTSVLYVASR